MTQELFEETPLNNNICVINDKYISEKKNTFHYKSKGKIFAHFQIEDANKKVLYKHKISNFTGKSTLCDPITKKVLFKFKSDIHLTNKPYEIIITSMKDDKEIQTITCNCSFKPSLKGYNCEYEFFNMATEKKELIELRCSTLFSKCSFYYGRKKENGVLICQINTLKSCLNCDYKIDIAPGVDTLFMLMIFIETLMIIQAS
ncbi:hypothetical protein BCR36DRAFT_371855 [Piromyces finnis]|uniref:Tubby C-terminal domain-containing protein n=1 Tax=Piromyces finnis TaxID=1754191 RepID=A0A1Y1V6R7_9FUNG|nr:hypothetical protein BCR36DRAFT_371855 [Piromyces finnis]|eukprot:ORX47372.1 hypothetical protein BCR36DRAFT_371855 [Piromyces finnis]